MAWMNCMLCLRSLPLIPSERTCPLADMARRSRRQIDRILRDFILSEDFRHLVRQVLLAEATGDNIPFRIDQDVVGDAGDPV